MLEKIPSGQQELSQEHRDMTTGGVMAIPFLDVQIIKTRFTSTSMVIRIKEKSMFFTSIAVIGKDLQYTNGWIRNHGVRDLITI